MFSTMPTTLYPVVCMVDLIKILATETHGQECVNTIEHQATHFLRSSTGKGFLLFCSD